MTNKFTRSLSSVLPRTLLPAAQATKRLVTDFAERSSMVYFGYVSQRSDDHHIVRGMTVSTQHVDDHYCIGTFKEYDVVFVERTDTIQTHKKHTWHIMEFDLKTSQDIPHIFIGSGRSGHGFHHLLATKYPSLVPAELGATALYPDSFTSHYTLYVGPEHAVTAERLVPPAMADMIGQHFKGLVIEITEHALYAYSEKAHLTKDLLDTMLANGAWLANTIDENSRSL